MGQKSKVKECICGYECVCCLGPMGMDKGAIVSCHLQEDDIGWPSADGFAGVVHVLPLTAKITVSKKGEKQTVLYSSSPV